MSKQQLIDLPFFFDANEDREILGGWHFGTALVVGLVTGGSDLSPTVCGLQLVTSTSTSSPDLELPAIEKWIVESFPEAGLSPVGQKSGHSSWWSAALPSIHLRPRH